MNKKKDHKRMMHIKAEDAKSFFKDMDEFDKKREEKKQKTVFYRDATDVLSSTPARAQRINHNKHQSRALYLNMICLFSTP